MEAFLRPQLDLVLDEITFKADNCEHLRSTKELLGIALNPESGYYWKRYQMTIPMDG